MYSNRIGYFENGEVESYSLNLGNGKAKMKVKNPKTTIYYDYIKAKKCHKEQSIKNDIIKGVND